MPDLAGVARLTVGAATITYLADGEGRAGPTATFPETTDADWQPYADFLDGDRFVTNIGGFLIERGNRTIVVDTGIGPVDLEFPGFGVYRGGAFLDSLAAAGVVPEAVTDVVFTHLHVDHVGWVTQPGDDDPRLTFPNARHLLSEDEWTFWHGGDNPAGPAPDRVQRPLEDRVTFVEDGEALAPGVAVIALPGHTPGHLGLAIADGDERVVLAGDVAYNPVQLIETGWAVAFDLDAAQARQTREAFLNEMAASGALVGFGHFASGPFGRVVRTEGCFGWEPV